MKALPKILLALTAVAAFSLAYPASVQAVPITYTYTGNPFTLTTGTYTPSDFVSGMLTLAGPLAANMQLTTVDPIDIIAFSFSDGVQTITQNNTTGALFRFATGAGGQITQWQVLLSTGVTDVIDTQNLTSAGIFDRGRFGATMGRNQDAPGTWSSDGAVADTGSTLSLMTLTLIALGLAARQFKRAAA